ncbi:MAG: isoleucine--tRNA ligase [Opitutales bacterium]
MPTDQKESLNLPRTRFPMRANLAAREPERLEHWQAMDLYGRMQAKNADAPEAFILHDGPPFTNGDVHIGTALNKVIKDTIVRYKNMRGFRAPYLPGWDSHGLPIEHKVMVRRREAGETLGPLEVRQACSAFAAEHKDLMMKQFQRLGVIGDWENAYWTIDPAYEAVEIETFAQLVEQGLVYRSKKPVHWSIPERTALAEAEIEYKDHKSPSIYVGFRLNNPEAAGLPAGTEAVIWTTTPWTIPANLAIAAGPKITYRTVTVGERTFLLAEDRIGPVGEVCGWENPVLSERVWLGSELEDLVARHPFIERDSRFVLADYVTTESGTGLVHTAPGHGQDDYLTGLKYGLEIYSPLDDENAAYIDDGQIPKALVGLTTLEIKGRAPANMGVLELLEQSGALLSLQTYRHQYPHCWRSKTPVIFRSMDQWFLALDKNGDRTRALQALDAVTFFPAWGEKRIRGTVENRPDWCISRQRAWGVPIVAFYDKDGKPLLDAGVIRGIAAKVRDHGTDIWWSWSAEQLLEGIDPPAGWPAAAELTPGRDTLDVWIDSACSQNAVLKVRPELTLPADVYFEGSDQHRGWFQSSLWMGVLSNGAAPFHNLITHGFIVNEDGTKISKSDGKKQKPQTSEAYVKSFGADIVRLWICSQDFRGDVPASERIIGNIINAYRSFRNTFRFQIGNLHDFEPAAALPLPELHPIDRWAVHRTAALVTTVEEAFDGFEFHRGFQLINVFVANTLSATYHDILKDRLYTLAPRDTQRRSAQTAVRWIFERLVKVMAPLLPFTTDEAWAYYREDQDFTEDALALQAWPAPDQGATAPDLAGDIDRLLAFKETAVNPALETLRQDKAIGQSLDAVIKVYPNRQDDFCAVLHRHADILSELYIVSEVMLVGEASEAARVEAVPAGKLNYARCPRSWRWVPELVATDAWGDVSPRCAKSLEHFGPEA